MYLGNSAIRASISFVYTKRHFVTSPTSRVVSRRSFILTGWQSRAALKYHMSFDKMSLLEIEDNMAAKHAHKSQITEFKYDDHIRLSGKFKKNSAITVILKCVPKIKCLCLKCIRRHSRLHILDVKLVQIRHDLPQTKKD